MAQKKYFRRSLFLVAGFLLLCGAITAYDIWRNQLRLNAVEKAQAPLTAHITEQTITHCSVHYLRCGHTVEEAPELGQSLIGAEADEMAALGWEMVWQEGEAYLSRENDGFCPADSQKRHIRLDQERMAVYAGPLGGGGQLLRQLDLPLQSVPARWLAQLTNGGIEFTDEETLLMALDNLDELADEWSEAIALPAL